jgi:hypothetical protein
MNSLKMIRILMSATAITLNVIAVLALNAPGPSSEPTDSDAIVIADRTSQAISSLFSNPAFTDHLIT